MTWWRKSDQTRLEYRYMELGDCFMKEGNAHMKGRMMSMLNLWRGPLAIRHHGLA